MFERITDMSLARRALKLIEKSYKEIYEPRRSFDGRPLQNTALMQ